MKQKNNWNFSEKENVYENIGYGRLEDSKDVLQRMRNQKRAIEPSPLLKEHMLKNGWKW